MEWHDPPGKRFTIMGDANRDRLLNQAKQLADALKLPLIDNG